MNTQDFIGALEITDAALERAAMSNPTPTLQAPYMCPRRIDDGSIERLASRSAGPTQTVSCNPTGLMVCRRIDDGALESAAQMTAPTGPVTMPPICRYIDDGALEDAAMSATGPTVGRPYCIDDGALEAAGAGQVRHGSPVTLPRPVGPCVHFDDNVLESTAQLDRNPTRGYGQPCLAPRIDDGALEAAAQLLQPNTRQMPFCVRIDDGALEASVDNELLAPTSVSGGCPWPGR